MKLAHDYDYNYSCGEIFLTREVITSMMGGIEYVLKPRFQDTTTGPELVAITIMPVAAHPSPK